MSFDSTLRTQLLQEWSRYAVDEEALRQALDLWEESQRRVAGFRADKERWAREHVRGLEGQVARLRASPADAPVDDDDDPAARCRTVGESERFRDFVRVKTSLAAVVRELGLVSEFLAAQHAIHVAARSRLAGPAAETAPPTEEEEEVLDTLAAQARRLVHEVDGLRPELPPGWTDRKVYTVGCFDGLHRGHENVLRCAREFGGFLVVGVHDDESYFKMKGKHTVEDLETRMARVKPFADQLYVVPHTDPSLYVRCFVSDQDVQAGACCYVRGDDSLSFPGREWVESVMPVHFVPRTAGYGRAADRELKVQSRSYNYLPARPQRNGRGEDPPQQDDAV